MNRTLGVFAKQPAPGEVKTRLAAATSPAFAAHVAAAFLADALVRFQNLAIRRVVVYTPKEAEAVFRELVAGRYELSPQAEGDLGRRLAAFFQSEFEAGAHAVVAVGADSPTLPVHFLNQAFAELAWADVVLGPTADGGYYLAGCARRLPPIFDGIDWGTSRVLEQTADRVKARGLRLALLPPWYDVDTLDDWQALRGHVAALRLAGVDPQLPHTEELLAATARS